MTVSPHKTDTQLVRRFLQGNPGLEDPIVDALLDWNTSLASPNPDYTRHKAKEFIQLYAKSLLNETQLPEEAPASILDLFEPLENIFRLAISLLDEGQLRDHLSHTIRELLFSNLLLHNYGITDRLSSNCLALAALFHDIAYPIEKFKKATGGIAYQTFDKFLDSKSRLHFELEDPQTLLTFLHKVGGLPVPSEYSIQLGYLYREIIARAVAGIGLFESIHCNSSVILFLRPIALAHGEDTAFWKARTNYVLKICYAMAFHDRRMYPPDNIPFATDVLAKALRIADELQEWGREDNELSYVQDFEILPPTPGVFLTIKLTMKDRTKGDPTKLDCKPHISITAVQIS